MSWRRQLLRCQSSNLFLGGFLRPATSIPLSGARYRRLALLRGPNGFSISLLRPSLCPVRVWPESNVLRWVVPDLPMPNLTHKISVCKEAESQLAVAGFLIDS